MVNHFAMMWSRRSLLLYAKAFVVVFVLCFTMVQLAAIRSKNKAERDTKDTQLKYNDQAAPDSKVRDQLNVAGNKDTVLANQNGQDDSLKIHKSKNQENVHKEDDENQNDDNLPKDPGQVEKPDVPAIQNIKPLDAQQNNDIFQKPGEGKENDVDLQVDPDRDDDNDNPEQIQKPVGNHEEEKKDNFEDGDEDEDGNEEEEDDEDQEEEEDEEEEDEEGNNRDFPRQRPLKPLRLSKLEPPDHLDAVKLEHDGHLNKKYRKEIFLGEKHQEFDFEDDEDPDDLLTDIFHRVDTDKDEFISLKELEDWIMLKVEEHFNEANRETKEVFKHLDTDKDGHIKWEEFHVHFLLAKGHDLKKAEQHVVDYETIPLDPDDKERIIRYKFRWAEADEEPQDNKLTFTEFKTFRHPEQSEKTLNKMVEDIIDNLDHNNDRKVSEDEFVALPGGDLDGAFQESDKLWLEERRKEFRKIIDLDHNGYVDWVELKNYVDPQNPSHSRLEAENLISMADEDNDDKLSLDEVLDNAELFLGSKMVDTGRNFHDEF